MFTNETVFISHGYSPIKTTVTRNHHKSIITGIKTVDFINSSGRTRSLHRGMNYYVYLLPYSNSTVIRGINGSDHTTNRVDNFSIPGSKGTDKVRNLCAVGEMSNDEKRYPSMREKCNDVPTPPAPVPSPPSPPPPPSPALPPGEAFFFHFNYSYQHDEYNASFWQIHGFSVKEVPIHSPPNSDNGIPKFHIDPKLPDNTHSLMMNNTYLIAEFTKHPIQNHVEYGHGMFMNERKSGFRSYELFIRPEIVCIQSDVVYCLLEIWREGLPSINEN